MNIETLAQGKYLRLVRSGTWEFAERTVASGIVVIVPFVSDDELLFVEQYRVPVAAKCIELPAGLAGDLVDEPHEHLIAAARRELLEETGFEAEHWSCLGTAAPSPGLTSEVMTFFEARGLHPLGSGGGIGNERITVLRVPISRVHSWLAAQAERACISMMVYAGLFLARR